MREPTSSIEESISFQISAEFLFVLITSAILNLNEQNKD